MDAKENLKFQKPTQYAKPLFDPFTRFGGGFRPGAFGFVSAARSRSSLGLGAVGRHEALTLPVSLQEGKLYLADF